MKEPHVRLIDNMASTNITFSSSRWHAHLGHLLSSTQPKSPTNEALYNTVQNYEISRKLLHISVGVLIFYWHIQGVVIEKILNRNLNALIILAAGDTLRHRFISISAIYRRVVGFLMRLEEANSYNSLIYYLLGTYLVMRIFPVDVAMMGILILSFADTAAATFGRLYATKTVYLRDGKSLAGTLAACISAGLIAAAFWSYVGADQYRLERTSMFDGSLSFCHDAKGMPPHPDCSAITGPWAVVIMSIITGLVAAGSEFVNLLGCDDNLTIPLLSCFGIWLFLSIFGGTGSA